jgi:hypothetical protein
MSSPDPQRSGGDLALLWRTRLEKAKAEYDLAVAKFRRSAEEYRTRSSEAGDTALREAVREENRAREHYLSVLQVFTDLIINGKIPPPSSRS